MPEGIMDASVLKGIKCQGYEEYDTIEIIY